MQDRWEYGAAAWQRKFTCAALQLIYCASVANRFKSHGQRGKELRREGSDRRALPVSGGSITTSIARTHDRARPSRPAHRATRREFVEIEAGQARTAGTEAGKA